jgi:hypothetical protein
VVGYQVRFSDTVKPSTYIKFMTDGILLAELHGDPLLRGYDTLIIDEAHERSLNIDFLLGFIKQVLPRRPDLRVIISSATLATERFAQFFGGAPVIEVSGRTFPVDVLYRPPRPDEGDLIDAVANTVNEITELDPRGDILVFLPGEREIREAMGALTERALPHTAILPLYARLSAAEQQRVFQTGGPRRVVLATNVAETSLTIPGIVYVVDAGVARVNRYDVRTGVTQLHVEAVSQASANQRKGRCGPHRQRRVLPAIRGGRLPGPPGLHRSRDQAGRPGRRHPAHEGPRPRRRRELPVPRPAVQARDRRGLPGARGAGRDRRGGDADDDRPPARPAAARPAPGPDDPGRRATSGRCPRCW